MRIETIAGSLRLIAVLAALVLLPGCAGWAPVPGGDDKVNSGFYSGSQDFLGRVNRLRPGMKQGEVFAILGRNAGEMTKLSRAQINAALYGGSSARFDGSLADQEMARKFLQSLYGYSLDYAEVEREHGFSSPIRVRTEEEGFKYNVLLVFQSGRLFDKPILSGGAVDDSSSKTLFDFLNPYSLFREQIE